jgi:hypothetical protein
MAVNGEPYFAIEWKLAGIPMSWLLFLHLYLGILIAATTGTSAYLVWVLCTGGWNTASKSKVRKR